MHGCQHTKMILKECMLTFKDSNNFKMDPSTAKTLLSITIMCHMLNKGLRIFKWKFFIFLSIKNRVIRQARLKVFISERTLNTMNIEEKIMTRLSRAITPLFSWNEESTERKMYSMHAFKNNIANQIYIPTKCINCWSTSTGTSKCLFDLQS